MRVHELAKELGVPSKEMLAELKELGAEVTTHMSAVEESVVELLRESHAADRKPRPPKKKAPPPTISNVESEEEESDEAAEEEAEETAKPTKPTGPLKVKDEKTPAPEPVSKPEPAAGEANLISLRGPIVVRDLAERLGVRPNQLIAELMAMNIFASINQKIEVKVAQTIVEKHGFKFEHERRAAEHQAVMRKPLEEDDEEQDNPEDLRPRPPVVTFLGHVDHGKTSLLDRIRDTAVAAGESGGITQHIGAYTIRHHDHDITFLDTPGHEAFTAMRARGANLTDIAVIVIAADDGIMPQTREAISHAKAADVAIIVAINKIDLPGARPERVRQQLQEIDLAPEDWGGQTICCEVSAITGDGMEHLIEMIHLQAEMLELRANPNRRAFGYVIEAQLEAGRGPTAHLLVTKGTLKLGDAVSCGEVWGRVRALMDDHGKAVKAAGPSIPVKCLGLSGVPEASREFRVCSSDKVARAMAEQAQTSRRTGESAPERKMSLEDLLGRAQEDEKLELRVILKTDVRGSLEAIEHALAQIKSEKISLIMTLADVGNITVNDVLLASASNAVVLGFHVAKENGVNAIAKREGVEIHLHSVIYELIDHVRESMTGLLRPVYKQNIIGRLEIKEVFDISKTGKIAGSIVVKGRITSQCRARVIRDQDVCYDGNIASLRRFKDSVSEVREGQECGVGLDNFADLETGDVIECYEMQAVTQEL